MNRYVLKFNSFNFPIPLHRIPQNWEPTSKNHPSSKPSSYFLLISSNFQSFFCNHCISPVSSSVFTQVLVSWTSLSSKIRPFHSCEYSFLFLLSLWSCLFWFLLEWVNFVLFLAQPKQIQIYRTRSPNSL